MSVLVERRITAPYLAPEREAFSHEFRKDIGPAFSSTLGAWLQHQHTPAKDAPKDYSDVVDPKRKGKMLMDSTDYDWFGTLSTVWGKEKTVEYMKRLALQNPLWRRGHGLTAQLLGAGEVPLAWAYFRPECMKSDGAPVDWIETFDPQRSVSAPRRLRTRVPRDF